jgi:hypothetical protein
VINSLSNSYDSAATNLTTIGTSQDHGFTPTSPPSTGTYNLGAGSYGTGSSGAATYSSTVKTGIRAANTPSVGRSGAVTNGVFEDEHTSLQDVALTPPDTIGMDPETGPYTGNVTGPTTSPFIGNIGGPFSGSANGGGDFGLTGDDGLLGDGGIPGESNYLSGRSNLGSSGVFGEDGFNSSGPNANGGSSLGNGPAEDEGAGAGAIGEGQGQSGTQGGMGGARRGGAGGGGEEEELGSSRYSRGRYFGGEEPGSGRGEWVQPSVGGDESLIVGAGARGSEPGRVTSAYDGATDAEGNPLRQRMGFGGRRGGSSNEDDERGERPDYLKEDPEWWKSAQKTAPPVIE